MSNSTATTSILPEQSTKKSSSWLSRSKSASLKILTGSNHSSTLTTTPLSNSNASNIPRPNHSSTQDVIKSSDNDSGVTDLKGKGKEGERNTPLSAVSPGEC